MFETWTIDRLEQTFIEAERRIGRLRAMQMALLDTLDAAQVAQADGSRNLAEWVSARADVAPETARSLVQTTRTTSDRPELRISLAEGDSSFDRCAATARLAANGASCEVVEAARTHDIAGVRRLASRHRRFDRHDEQEVFDRRHLVLQASLDEAMGRIYGEFSGSEWRVIEKAITDRADTFPGTAGCERPTAAQRRADALTAICQDSIDGWSGDGRTTEDRSAQTPLLTVFVDDRKRHGDPGHIDAEVAAGPRVGLNTIDRILCQGRLEAIGVTEGRPLAYGRTKRAVPSRLRRFVLQRDGGCTIDGCTSRYRLQPHHVLPWSDGGTTDADNLATLCWYHHHVTIHGRGFRVDPDSPPHRRRLLRPSTRRAPPD